MQNTDLSAELKVDYKEQIFHMWDATPSLSRILLRNPKNEAAGRSKNIDIMFWGVKYLDLPFILRGLSFDSATEEEIAHIAQRLGDTLREHDIVYVIVSERRRYFIAAVAYKIVENDLEIFDTSLVL